MTTDPQRLHDRGRLRAGARAASTAKAHGWRRLIHIARPLLIFLAVSLLVWTLVVWRWQDPLTALYTLNEQRSLAAAYERAVASWGQERADLRSPAASGAIAAVARRYRHGLERGDPVGRLGIPRLDLDLIVANGVDDATLRMGPARDLRSFVPGEGELVYLAGHRTTYLAPFSRLDVLRRGDRITLEVPYATFTYAVTRHVVVDGSDISVLRSPERETLALQACHPRFFADMRYVVFARLVAVTPHISG